MSQYPTTLSEMPFVSPIFVPVMWCWSAVRVKSIRFKESDVRAIGRSAKGVRGIRLRGDQQVISLIIPKAGGFLLSTSEKGFGKRTPVTDFPVKGRAAKGTDMPVM